MATGIQQKLVAGLNLVKAAHFIDTPHNNILHKFSSIQVCGSVPGLYHTNNWCHSVPAQSGTM
eukprot:3103205-Ditylum_brightwellii.AAC.1